MCSTSNVGSSPRVFEEPLYVEKCLPHRGQRIDQTSVFTEGKIKASDVALLSALCALSSDAVKAVRKYIEHKKLPQKMSPDSALDVMAIAVDRKLHNWAFKKLIEAFKEGRDSLTDYCSAIGRVDEQIRKLHKPKLSDSVRLNLSQAEANELCTVLKSRGMGPVCCRDLSPVYSNYRWVGLAFRSMTLGSEITLRVVRKKDIHNFVQYCEKLDKGVLRPDAVKNMPHYSTKVAKIEISSELLTHLITVGDKEMTLSQFLDELRARNPSVEISLDPKDFPGRFRQEQVEKAPYFPVQLSHVFMSKIQRGY